MAMQTEKAPCYGKSRSSGFDNQGFNANDSVDLDPVQVAFDLSVKMAKTNKNENRWPSICVLVVRANKVDGVGGINT